jgi:divalent metal cation (Fe/Co/Zn/Cd) transporter
LGIRFVSFSIFCLIDSLRSSLVGQGYKPNVNVVLLEDLAAVLGVTVAATAMSLSIYLQSPIPDAIGSLVIGGILGAVASFIIYSNTAALVGRWVITDVKMDTGRLCVCF